MKPTCFSKPTFCSGLASLLLLALPACTPLATLPGSTVSPTAPPRALQTGDAQPIPEVAKAPAPEAEPPLELRFSVRGSDLLPGQDGLIEDIGQRLAQNPKQKVTLVGSTEPLGSRAYSLAIASERVQKIRSLLKRKGARLNQIVAYPVGYSSRLACTGKHCQPGSNARVLVVFSDE